MPNEIEIKEPVILTDVKTGEEKLCVLLRLRKQYYDRLVEIPIILDQDTEKYLYVDTTLEKLTRRLNERNLLMEFVPEHQYQICDSCHKFIQEGFVFEGDGTCYCDECRQKVVSEEEYNELYDEGLAYWTEWYSC